MTTPPYDKLMAVFTVENLDKISSVIIRAYREKKYAYLNNIARTASTVTNLHENRINKIFSQLIMLYHPDRLGYYHREINTVYKNGKPADLNQFAHIFRVLDYIDRSALDVQAQPAATRAPQPDGDTASAGEEETSGVIIHDYFSEHEPFDFISALKHKEYGNLDVVYHEYDLMHVEGALELSGYNISDLSGLDLCSNLTSLDLSNNNIFDILQIGHLPLLEELDLSSNHITNIDVLARLQYLKRVDLSFNKLEDISALLDLHNLEYVNIIGNNIADDQINLLRDKKIIVI